jgi:DNA-binding CsgD family transcriptional regulator
MSISTIFPPLTVKPPTEYGSPSRDRDGSGGAVDERRLHDQPELEVAERFAAADALLVAAEAADAAAAAHRDASLLSSARAAAARCLLWLAKCEGARPPTMLAAPEALNLTSREREIALLAAAGASSREIAGRLVISVRTVDNHLRNAYRKLGVTRRQDLPRVLGVTPE